MIPALIGPLVAQGLNLLGNAVLAKGKEWVEEKTGVKLDGPLSNEDITKLRQFEMEHEEELLRLRLEDKKLDLSVLQMDADDRASAREREAALAYSDAHWVTKNIVSILAIGTLIFAFGLVTILALVDVPDKQKDILIYALGFATNAGTMVLAYYFGSSQGSKDKTDDLKALIGGRK